MNSSLFALLGSALVLAPTAVLADSPPAPVNALAPTKPWVVEWAESSCVASRQYEAQGKPITLALRPSPMGGTMQLILLAQRRSVDAYQGDTTIRGGTGEPIKNSMLSYPIDDKTNKTKLTAFVATLSAAQFHALDGAQWIGFQGHDLVQQNFRLSQFSAVQAKLAECLVNLKRYWLMSDDQIRRIKVPPTTTNVVGLFSSSDYPTQALRENNTGTVGVRLMIDDKGVVQDCMANETSGSAVLDAMTCIVLRQRAKFKPARDVDGKPVHSYYDQRVTWQIPG